MSPNTTLILAALVAFGISVSSALRGALTAKVPPAWVTLPAQYRPLAASVVSAVLTFLLAIQAGQGWASAGAAAIVVLGASLSHLIAAEGDAAGVIAAPAPAPAEAPKPPPVPPTPPTLPTGRIA